MPNQLGNFPRERRLLEAARLHAILGRTIGAMYACYDAGCALAAAVTDNEAQYNRKFNSAVIEGKRLRWKGVSKLTATREVYGSFPYSQYPIHQ